MTNLKDETLRKEADRTIELERYIFAANNSINPRIAHENIKLTEYLHYQMDALTYTLTAAIWGEQLKRIYARYPINWIESFKERWLPEWLKRRYSVRYNTIDVDIAALYPQFVLPRENYGSMKIVVMDKSYPKVKDL